jgi:hypothetical protein
MKLKKIDYPEVIATIVFYIIMAPILPFIFLTEIIQCLFDGDI